MSEDFVRAEEAAQMLGVKRQTLYAYVSRGWLESVPSPGKSRAKLYRKADIKRLRARSDARSGEGPVAASALRWGAPVLETQICEIRVDGPMYRGHRLASLVEDKVSFEGVAELLWSGELAPTSPWESHERVEKSSDREPIDAIRRAVLECELGDETRFVNSVEAVTRQARVLLGAMASACGAGEGDSIAERVAVGLGGGIEATELVETGMVVCAEHELNVSAFAARVAASSGANLYACVSAALAAFTGPRHGGMARRIGRLLDEVSQRSAREVIVERLGAGVGVPGFGHPLYERGDPRFEILLAAAQSVREDPVIESLLEAAADLEFERPNLDLGLAALARAAGLRSGSESAIFSVGRAAGWIAHAREQAAQGFLLRPRARYVGSGPA